MEQITSDIHDKRFNYVNLTLVSEKYVGYLYRPNKIYDAPSSFAFKPVYECPCKTTKFDKPTIGITFSRINKYPAQNILKEYGIIFESDE